MTRAREATDAAALYGELRAVVLIVDDVVLTAALVDDVETSTDLAIARDKLRKVRDRLYNRVRRDVDPLERLEFELDRAADEAGLERLT